MKSFSTLLFAILFAGSSIQASDSLQKVKSWKHFSYFYHLLKGDVTDKLIKAIEENNQQHKIELTANHQLLLQMEKKMQEQIAALEKIVVTNEELVKKMKEDLSVTNKTTAEMQKNISDAQNAFDNLKRQITDHDFKINDFQKSLSEHRRLFEKALTKTDDVVKENQSLIEKFHTFVKSEDKIVEGLKQEIVQNKELLQQAQKEILLLCESNKNKIEKLEEEVGGNKNVCQQLNEQLQKFGKSQKSL